LLMSISCGAMVISEYAEDTAPYKPGVHFVQAKAEELTDVICHYIKNENQRQTIADCAYKFITQELTLENSLMKIMETCCANTVVQTGSI
jgi:spore maturation protein CgeB